MKNTISVLLILGLYLVTGCGKTVSPYAPTSVEKYLNEVIDIMKANHVNRNSIDWDKFRSDVFQKAAGASTIAETNAALLYALELLNDNSSFMITATGALLTLNSPCSDVTPPDVTTDPDIGYIKMPAFNKSGLQGAIFSETKQNEIKAQDKTDLKGWIVDLRGNTGGNFWPMVAGLGPVLGEGTVGFFIDSDGVKAPIKYEAGSAKFNDEAQVTVSFPYTIVSSGKKVAVLTDHATGNAGEAVTITFIGKENTRIFGGITCGQGGGNQTYNLSDGSILYLTVAEIGDRNGTAYNDSLTPDEVVTDASLIYEKAVEWINLP